MIPTPSPAEEEPSRGQLVALALLRRLPRRLLARWLGRLTRVPLPRPLRPLAWGFLARRLGIDLGEARSSDPRDYSTFEKLFTRNLRDGVRPLEGEERDPVCPVDGTLSGIGSLAEGTLVQAKGRTYSLEALLATPGCQEVFRAGWYATSYLSPKDYHRIHAPANVEIHEVVHVPGTCFPVFPAAVRDVEALFVQNERVVLLGSGPSGRVALVAVAAFGVGNIRLPWLPALATNRPFQGHSPRRYDVRVSFRRGEEIGVFALGSTVITLFDEPFETFREPGPCRVGQRLARRVGFPGS